MLSSAQAQTADALVQAQFFVRKGWFADAALELEPYLRTEDGRIDPEAWYLLAVVRHELGELDAAREAAERAHSHARTEEQLEQASAFAAYLRDSFGVLTVEGPWSGMNSRLDISLQSVVFDSELKDWLLRLIERYDEPVELPARIGLPTGSYRINGREISVLGGEEQRLQLDRSELSARGPVASQLSTVELGVGSSMWFGEDAEGLLPAVATRLALVQPLGRVVVAATLDWDPRSYRRATDGLGSSLDAWGLGAQLGWALTGGDPLWVRPSVGYRYARLPGIARSCTGQGPVECRADAPTDVVIHSVAHAHVLSLELAADLVNRGGRVGLGLGMRVAGELAAGRLPAQADARTPTGALLPYTVAADAQSVRASGARGLFVLSIAL